MMHFDCYFLYFSKNNFTFARKLVGFMLEVKVRRYIFSLMLVLVASTTVAVAWTSFLPMEDGYFTSRDDVVYGASIESTKPYRQPLTTGDKTTASKEPFGSVDILICVLLIGVYFAFTHKKTQTRNIDL